jgi:hypothetical protein
MCQDPAPEVRPTCTRRAISDLLTGLSQFAVNFGVDGGELRLLSTAVLLK